MHTPGPWKVVPSWDERIVEIKYRSGTIVSWHGFDKTPKTSRMDNARLIAAAPDLLDAVEDAHRELTSQAEYFGSHLDPDNNLFRILRKLESVITKAKGS